jgi:DNA replication protein DnaC
MANKAELDELQSRATTLRLYGLLTAWDRLGAEPWVAELIDLETRERARRSKEYRIRNAQIGTFKAMADFDWKQPSKIDRAHIEELFELGFLEEPANVVLLGPNGVGKTMIAQNLAYESVLRGHATRFCVAADLLNDLAGVDGSLLRARVKKYVAPKLLVIDEVGYLRYDNRHADLLYEVVRRRYDKGGSIVVTTNKAFSEWNQVFESAACLVTLIDRLCHRAEIVEIRGESYRVKEAKARSKSRRARERT